MAERQLKLANDVARAYEQMSLSAISNFMHPDYVHVVRPDSTNVPKRNKAQYLEYFGKMFDNWTKLSTVSHSSSRRPTFFHPH